jgi:transcriptional regulator with XRE-family HTH domain
MNFYDVTGRQLRDARELLGLSPHQLGARSGVNRLTLRLWEASGDEPPNALAPNLSRVLRYLQIRAASTSNGPHHRQSRFSMTGLQHEQRTATADGRDRRRWA